jgi:hypothetical protein
LPSCRAAEALGGVIRLWIAKLKGLDAPPPRSSAS